MMLEASRSSKPIPVNSELRRKHFEDLRRAKDTSLALKQHNIAAELKF